jgi:TRAP-type C4-dicarboxylate transport system permease small subunit
MQPGRAMNYYRTFEKTVHKISRSFMYLAAASLFLMMLLTTCDVVGRYVLNSPVKGAQDMTEFGLVLIGFSALGYLTSERHHMRADIINTMLPPRKNAILGAVCFLMALPFAIALAWETCAEGLRVVCGTYLSPTLSVPLGPFYLFAGFGLILLCVEIILDVVRYISEARGQHFADGDEKGLSL